MMTDKLFGRDVNVEINVDIDEDSLEEFKMSIVELIKKYTGNDYTITEYYKVCIKEE